VRILEEASSHALTGGDDVAAAALEAGVSRNIVVLRSLADRQPDRASMPIEAAIDRALDRSFGAIERIDQTNGSGGGTGESGTSGSGTSGSGTSGGGTGSGPAAHPTNDATGSAKPVKEPPGGGKPSTAPSGGGNGGGGNGGGGNGGGGNSGGNGGGGGKPQ
jgi:hypothetical protein